MPRLAVAIAIALIVGAGGGALAFALVDEPDAPATLEHAPTTGAAPTTGTVPTTGTAPTTPTPAIAAATPTGQTPRPTAETGALPTNAALRAIARRAARPGERVRLAVTASGRIVSAAASSGSTRTPFRVWSVSKPATVIALLRAHGWGARAGQALRPDVQRAIRSALVRSGDCAQRQLVVELQDAAGGVAPARAAVQRVFRDAGATDARVLDRAAEAGAGCRSSLAATETPDPYRTALQLGTAEWAIQDAARFALALGDGTYPRSITRKLMTLLRAPKLHADDPFAHGLDVTTRLDWGAGQALGDLQPAYKAGWGGSSGETATFVVEQVIHLRSSAGVHYGIAVSYEPPTIPARDDPGLTRAPAALHQALAELARLLRLR